jgi:hypothetical protein
MDPILFKTDDGNFVRFQWEAAKNEAQSLQAGRPIFDKVLFAYVMSPGVRQEAVHEIERLFGDGTVRRREPVAQRYARQLQAFLAQEQSPDLTGTPLDQWPALDVRQRAELKAMNIHTVEALAGLADAGLQRIGMGARELQGKARAFLAQAAGSADAERLAGELARRDAEIDRLRAQVAELAAALQAQADPAPRGTLQ